MRSPLTFVLPLAALLGPAFALGAGCGGSDSSTFGGGTASTTTSHADAGAGGGAGANGHAGASGGSAGGAGHGGSGHGGGLAGAGQGGAGHAGAGQGGVGHAGAGQAGAAATGSGGAAVGGGGGGAAPPADAGAQDAASDAGHPIVTCMGHVYQCGDGIDNDGDGLIDEADPDCLGPCDNTEDSYYGGIPGQAGPACDVDCYFDSNSGSGDDNCYWNHKCDPHEATPPGAPEPASKCAYDPKVNVSGTPLGCSQLEAEQSAQCHSFCGPLTPNGCDCFGCCELPAGSGKYVWLGSTDPVTKQGSCTIDVVGDPTKCEPCLPVPSCLNTCEKCELCIGKNSVPPECLPGGGPDGGAGGADGGGAVDGGAGGADGGGAVDGGGGGAQCAAGVQACGLPGQPACPYGYYCITGCCQMHI
jgi:hypothetical protein